MRDFPYLVMGSTAAGGLGCRFRRALAASCARDGYGGGHFFALSGLEHLSGAAHQRVRGVETSTLPSLVTIGRRYRIQSVCDCERSTISERAPAMAQHLNDALDIPVREKLSELMQRAQKEAAEKAGAAAG